MISQIYDVLKRISECFEYFESFQLNIQIEKDYLYIPKKVINIYISYTLNSQLRKLDTDFTLGNCLFGSVKLTKNADLDKYKYSG